MKNLPMNLEHKPIYACKYDDYDAKFLSIGEAQYDNDCASVKILRYDEDNKKWSRQSEELPIRRLFDATAFSLSILKMLQKETLETEKNDILISYLGKIEMVSDIQKREKLIKMIRDDASFYRRALIEIKQLLSEINLDKI